jgi:hypothetical protein
VTDESVLQRNIVIHYYKDIPLVQSVKSACQSTSGNVREGKPELVGKFPLVQSGRVLVCPPQGGEVCNSDTLLQARVCRGIPFSSVR